MKSLGGPISLTSTASTIEDSIPNPGFETGGFQVDGDWAKFMCLIATAVVWYYTGSLGGVGFFFLNAFILDMANSPY